MFTLRIIEETRENEGTPFEQVIENFALGNSYTVIRNGKSKEFDTILESYHGINKNEIESVLCSERRYDDNNIFFIMRPTANQQFSYFIMTESGKTFERL